MMMGLFTNAVNLPNGCIIFDNGYADPYAFDIAPKTL